MLTEGSAENRSIIGRAPGITGRDVAENVADISRVILVFKSRFGCQTPAENGLRNCREYLGQFSDNSRPVSANQIGFEKQELPEN